MNNRRKSLVIALSTCLCGGPVALGQVQPGNNPPPNPLAQQLPLPAAMKKTVVFIRANCLHVPSADEQVNMSPQDRARWSDENIAKLKSEEIALLPQDSYVGTGFLVFFSDERAGKGRGFNYLVTNRHVAQPGIEKGKPCRLVNYSFSLNHIGPTSGTAPYLQSLEADPQQERLWVYPTDDSVDLAVLPFGLQREQFDFETVPFGIFVSEEMIQRGEVVEGDPVMFTGLFIQYAGVNRLEPVVRSGSIAMLPSDPIQTTLRKLGHIYLTEVHAFGGNSGSPVFVDVNRFKNSVGFDYKFLGVIAGEIPESSDLSLQITTSYTGKIEANSGISVVVPAVEVKKLLLSQPLQALRDTTFQQQPISKPTK